MLAVIEQFFGSFILGLGTPLTAACVLPLYPGFISYISRQFSDEPSKKTYTLFGLVVVSGVLAFMGLLGILFTTLLQKSLTSVIGVVSPIAFGLLGIVSLFLIFDVNFQSSLSFSVPEFENPLLNGFSFGFFFGAIIIPCNPGFISVFFARSFLFSDPVNSLLNFLFFGLGIGFPLLVFSVLSSSEAQKVTGFITDNKSIINRFTGLMMLVISVYYLVKVFGVL